MKTKRVIGLFVLISCYILTSFSQSQIGPQPLMNKNILRDFINQHFDYPEKSLNDNKEGTVIFEFKTDKEGKVSSVEIETPVSKEIDSAALQLFSLIIWQPATDYGVAVEGKGNFEVNYNIKKFNKLSKSRDYRHIDPPFKPVDTSKKIYSVKQLNEVPRIVLDSNFKSLNDFVYHNLQFPASATKLHLEGTVVIKFVIETDGLPSNIFVMQPVGGGCSEEAVRIIQMTSWIPGIKQGMAVRSFYEMNIKFVPPEDGSSDYIPSQANTGL